jgi:putative MATE family efflux protein
MAVTTLYNVVDTIFIGHFVGSLGIAGLSIVFPVQMLFVGIAQMMGIGGASLISRMIGADNIPRAEKALGNALMSTLVLSAVIVAIALSNVDFWLRLIGASETILPYARDYMTIIMYGMFFQTFSMTSNLLIRAEGNVRVPMIGMLIGASANIALDAIFIIILDMGIKGAATATVIAQFVAILYYAFYYLFGKSFLKIALRNLILEWKILREIFAVGVASLFMMVATSVSTMFVNIVLVKYGGDIGVSTYGVVNRLMMFAIMPGIVIGQGLQPILGYNYGAKRFKLALKACCIVVFLVLFFLPEPFIKIFTGEMELVALSVYAARRVFVTIFVTGFLMVGTTTFQSIGKAMQSFVTSISRSALFLLPLILILPHFWGINGIWLAFPITDALTFIVTLLFFIPQVKELQSMSTSVRVGGEEVYAR